MQTVQSVIEILKNGQLEDKVRAIDRMIEVAGLLSRESVKALEREPNRLFLAERLYQFGSIVIPELEVLLKESGEEEVRVLAALVLLQLGSRQGIPYLNEVLRGSSEYVPLVALRLSETGERESGKIIIDRLRSDQADEGDVLVALLSALKKLKIDLPQDLKEKFSSPDLPWQVNTMVKS